MIVTPEIVREFLGVPKFRTEREIDERVKQPGVPSVSSDARRWRHRLH